MKVPAKASSMSEAYGRWVVNNRRWIIPVVLLLCVALASGVRNLGFNNDYRVYFGEDNPQLQDFERLQDVYTKNDVLIVMLEPESGNIFTPEFLAAVQDLTERSWQLPFGLRVDSITNFQHSYAEGDELIVEDLILDPASMPPSKADSIAEILRNEPLLYGRLVSRDFACTAVNVTFQLPEEDPQEVPTLVAAIREEMERFHADHSGIKSYLTGSVMMNNAFTEASQTDIRTLVPIMYGLIIVVMYIVLRSVFAVVGTLLVIGLSTMVAMGVAASIGIQLTPPSAQSPPIILTLAVADCVHILIAMFREMRTNGLCKHDAIVASIRMYFFPVFLTSLTTAIGFLSLNFSDVPPFRDLGNITAFGVAAAFGLSVLLLPALMAVLPIRVKPQAASTRPSRMLGLAEFVIARKNPLLVIVSTLVIGACFCIPMSELNDQFIHYFDERIQFRTDSDYISERLVGMYTIEHSIGSDGANGIADPEYLRILKEFEQWYEEQPETRHVASIVPILEKLNRNLHGDDPAYYRLPQERDLAAQYLLLYEMSLPYGLDLNNQINVDKSATRFTATLENVRSVPLRDLERRAAAWLEANAPEPMHSRGTSPGVMFAYIAERNILSMIRGTLIAFGLVSLVLVFALKSLRFGALSLIPNLAPIALTFGLWGLFIGEVGLAVSVTAAMSLGIVVDDTVHFLSKYLNGRRFLGLSPEDSVRHAFGSVGTALVATSVILMCGFVILTFSAFHLNTAMGKLVSLTIVGALAFDFLMLPAILLLVDRKQPQETIQ